VKHFIYNNEYKVDDILEGSCEKCKNTKITLAHLICSYVIDSNFIKDVLNKVQNINMKDSYNRTFLHFVCNNSVDIELILLIVSRGADVNATTTDGERPIHYAMNEDIIKLLKNNGATYDINEKILWEHGSYDQLSYMNKIRNEEITMANKRLILYNNDMSSDEKIKLIGEIQNKI
jgi:ankyrin repeat protein